jgi:hypothetical protein
MNVLLGMIRDMYYICLWYDILFMKIKYEVVNLNMVCAL